MLRGAFAVEHVLSCLLACSWGTSAFAQPATTQSATAPATTAAAAATAADDGWVMAPKYYASTRYSGLNQINTSNAKDLKLAWTFPTGTTRGHEAAPLVIGDMMYLVTPYPNFLYGIDLKNPGQPKWKYEPNPTPAAKGVACCDYVNRGCAYWDGKVVFNTLDAHTVAVDARTGDELWKTRLGDINTGETMTMAPLIVKGKVLVGNSGGEFGVRGWLAALDVNNGRVLWRAYSTGPDAEVLIGPNFKPFYDMDKGTDLGVHTWPPDQWQIGGGTVWGWISYDPQLDLIYYGTGNPGGWNPEIRPGDNKWACGIFARRPDTGEATWYYQTSPHDLWDHDGVNECILLELPVDGADKPPRKVLIHPGRTGYMYVIDRATGQVLSAEGFVRNTAALGVDLKTGRLIPNEQKHPYIGRVVRDITPVAPGAKDWQPSAYSFSTGLLYVPHQHLSMDWESTEANYIAGTPYLGAQVKMYADPAEPGRHRGEYMAWDIVNKKKVWGIKEKFPVWCGTLATGGDVCFYGNMEGVFKAVNAKTGEVLWQHQCESGIIGQPVTYKGPDGKQYVAILSGVGGWAGAIVAGDLDPRDPTAALGFVGAMKDLPQHTKKGGGRCMCSPSRSWVLIVAVMLLSGCSSAKPQAAASSRAPQRVLHVVADPNNLPFSNEKCEGFENKVAELIARRMNAKLEYTWRAQRRGFFRHAFNDDGGQLVMGVPAGFERALTTAPYYRSSYVFVWRKDRNLNVRSLNDPVLRDVKVGVQLVGDDGADTPPAHALARRGIVNNVRRYTIYGDYTQPNPPARIMDAVVQGDVDVAVVWGPLAGFYARRGTVPLEIAPVMPAVDPPGMRFAFSIALGVRKDDQSLRDELNVILTEERAAIERILDDFGVPRVPEAPATPPPTAALEVVGE